MMRLWVPGLCCVLGLGLALPALAQVPAAGPVSATDAAPAAFEVVSVRPTGSVEQGHIHIWSDPANGDFRAQNVSVTDLLEFAYDLPESRFVASKAVEGLLRAPRFDVEAKSGAAMDQRLHDLPTAEAKQRKRELVRGLLADRFGLRSHMETRELPVYDLQVAKGGPKFTASVANGTSYNMGRGSLSMEGGDGTVSKMADNLAAVLGRPVIDQTGITGRYLMKLRWAADDAASDSGLPSIFTAVEEQLGLKLVAGKAPVAVLVVDGVGMPSAN